MSKELKLWKRIQAALEKKSVEGLTVTIDDQRKHGYTVTVVTDGSFEFIPEQSEGPVHRAAAMLVVDALEAAEVAQFDRESAISDGQVVWVAEDVKWERIGFANSRDHDGKEHLALLSLLADVTEAVSG